MPKQHILRLRKTDTEIFAALNNDSKKVETRAATVKNLRIKEGDELVFVCGEQRLTKTVGKVRHFKSINGLFRAYPLQAIFPNLKTKKEALAVWAKFPGYEEKIKEGGILAFELKAKKG